MNRASTPSTALAALAFCACLSAAAWAQDSAKPAVPDPDYCARRDADPQKCLIQDGPPNPYFISRKPPPPPAPAPRWQVKKATQPK